MVEGTVHFVGDEVEATLDGVFGLKFVLLQQYRTDHFVNRLVIADAVQFLRVVSILANATRLKSCRTF